MTNFMELKSMEEMEAFIHEHDLAFLYITMPNCSVCHGLKPQIETMLSKYPNIHTSTVDAHEVKEVAGRFNIFTAPVLLLFVHGKEYIREARIVQTKRLDEKISRIYNNVNS